MRFRLPTIQIRKRAKTRILLLPASLGLALASCDAPESTGNAAALFGRQLSAQAATAAGTFFGYRLAPAAKPRVGNALPLGKCINMGGMLEFDREAQPPQRRFLRADDFRIIREAGFDTVRLPVKFSIHTAPRPPYEIRPAFMKRMEEVSQQALAANLNIIIDLHHYKEVQADPDGQRERFVAIWRQISEKFRNYDNRLWFELLNEPGDLFWNKRSLDVIFTPALQEIRRTNPTRPIIITGQYGSQIRSLATLELPDDDPNLHPTFHFYEPKPFTHQGAKWTTQYHPVGTSFTNADRAIIDANVALVKAYINRTGRVPFLGEYGAIDIAGVSDEQRVRYYEAVSAAFASIGVQSCAWSYTNGFSLYRNGAWIKGMPEAIRTTTTLLPPD